MAQDYIVLKWGTLKGWQIHSEEQLALLRRYVEIGASASVMLQRDTDEQKQIVCSLIDLCDADTIYLDWDDKYVSKDEAKQALDAIADVVLRYRPKPKSAPAKQRRKKRRKLEKEK